MEENKNFQVTVNDASKTVYLDDDGNPVEAAAQEQAQPAEEKLPKKK